MRQVGRWRGTWTAGWAGGRCLFFWSSFCSLLSFSPSSLSSWNTNRNMIHRQGTHVQMYDFKKNIITIAEDAVNTFYVYPPCVSLQQDEEAWDSCRWWDKVGSRGSPPQQPRQTSPPPPLGLPDHNIRPVHNALFTGRAPCAHCLHSC